MPLTYYYFDGVGSVMGLVNPAGVARARYSYDAFGDHAYATALNGALPPNPWRFAGGYLDPTGLYHFGARYYDPTRGRWTQQDSIISLGNPAKGNRYAYAGDDPVNRVDPSGRVDVDCGFFEAGCSFKLSATETQDLIRLLEVGAGAAALSEFLGDLPGGVIGAALIIDAGALGIAADHGQCALFHVGLDLVTQGLYHCSDYGD